MNQEQNPTVLITVTGKDRPGVTAAIFETLARFAVSVVDMEQIVLRERLILGILITAPRDIAKLADAVESTVADLDLDVEVARGEGDNERRKEGRALVTVLGRPLPPAAVSAVTGRIADTGANIDRIVRMARYPVTAIEFQISGADFARLRTMLAQEAVRQHVDVAVQRAGLVRHGRRLLVLDVDSTLVQGEVVDMLAEHAGVGQEVAVITERAMRGELRFEASVRERVRLLAGLDATALDAVYEAMELAPGARTLVRTLKRLGYRLAIVSGGFSQLTDRWVRDLEIDYSRANELEIVEGRLTGKIVGPVVDRAGKAQALQQFAADSKIPLDRTIAVGDGANDLDMLAVAGLGIAFNAKPVVRDAAHTALNVPYLDAILYLLGITREEIEAADAAAAGTS
ncbi:MAG: phosphoserine phosphatase SerB [Nocardioidaceae bacterium]|nr:phosphoserine phosphatase SerB [Nocardioidaceae bacterium]